MKKIVEVELLNKMIQTIASAKNISLSFIEIQALIEALNKCENYTEEIQEEME